MSCCTSNNNESISILNKTREAAVCAQTNCASAEESAEAAALSAYAASVSAGQAAASAALSGIYLGPKATAPTTDNEGNPLQEGMQYFNTTDSVLYIWNGTSWQSSAFNEFTDFLATGTTTARDLATRMADVVNVKDFGAVGDGVADDTAAIQAAIDYATQKGTNIYIPSGYYVIKSPIVLTSGSRTLHIFGDGQINTHFVASPFIPDSDRGMFEYIDPISGWGLILENLHFIGNSKEWSCIKARKCAYLRFSNLNIEGFIGSALNFDKVQDSVIEGCNIQNNGKSTGDGTINSETTHYPIYLHSTIAGDACNMIRFDNCQIEQNKVSPFIKITSGIGLMFNHIHSEIRNNSEWYTKDLFEIESCQISITGMNADRFRYGLVDNGYCDVRIVGGRKIGQLKHNTSGKTGLFQAINTNFTSNSSSTPEWLFNSGNIDVEVYGCSFERLYLRYPLGIKKFTDCSFSEIEFTNSGSSSSKQIFTNCDISGDVTIPTGATVTYGTSFIGGRILGNVNGLGSNAELIDTDVTGTLTYDQAGVFNLKLKDNRILYRTAPPIFGNWLAGSIVYNTQPIAGGNIGWVCVVAGTPGTWKTFGTISA